MKMRWRNIIIEYKKNLKILAFISQSAIIPIDTNTYDFKSGFFTHSLFMTKVV